MALEIRKADHETIYGLMMARDQGRPVFATPHVGNVHQGMLALGKLGFDLMCYDRVMGETDFRYLPHGILVDGCLQVVSNARTLLTHATVHSSPKLFPDLFRDDERPYSLRDLHLDVLSHVLPGTRVVGYTEYVRERADFVEEALAWLTHHDSMRWQKRVCMSGHVYRTSVRSWKHACETGVFGVTQGNEMEGLLIPNIWTILLTFVMLANGREMYYLVGPDFKKYLTMNAQILSQHYDVLQKQFQDMLPETLLVNVVEAADMPFVCLKQHRSSMDALVEALMVVENHRLRRQEEVQKSPEHLRKSCIREFDERGRGLINVLRSAIANAPARLNWHSASSRVTQYDMLFDELYLHPSLLEMRFDNLLALATVLQRFAFKPTTVCCI